MDRTQSDDSNGSVWTFDSRGPGTGERVRKLTRLFSVCDDISIEIDACVHVVMTASAPLIAGKRIRTVFGKRTTQNFQIRKRDKSERCLTN